MYHCPGSYCIPYDKVCDGSRDCPSGHDELQCSNYSCPGILKFVPLHKFNLMKTKYLSGLNSLQKVEVTAEFCFSGLFRCKGESFCLQRDKVCDAVDCPKYRDDEKYCSVQGSIPFFIKYCYLLTLKPERFYNTEANISSK